MSGKLVDIQALRALAAFTVAVAHIGWGFADKIGDGLGLALDHTRASQGAVMLFFVISGFIMVVSSRRLFGQPDAQRVFMTRRVVRVLPPYWLATMILLAVLLALVHQPVDWGTLPYSMLLIPHWSELHGLRSQPILWPGWTLFYEMIFYLLFALLIAKGRLSAVMGAVGGIILLVTVGLWITPEMAPDNSFIWTVSRPVLLVFLPGMALAYAREAGWRAAPWLRLTAVLAAVAVCFVTPKPASIAAMGFDYLAWCAVPAILLAFAVIGGPIRLPAHGMLTRGGDMSYALYLLHIPIAWFWIWFYPKLPGFSAGAWDYLVTCLIVTTGLSWLFYARIEQPMTARLNAILNAREASPHGDAKEE